MRTLLVVHIDLVHSSNKAKEVLTLVPVLNLVVYIVVDLQVPRSIPVYTSWYTY